MKKNIIYMSFISIITVANGGALDEVLVVPMEVVHAVTAQAQNQKDRIEELELQMAIARSVEDEKNSRHQKELARITREKDKEEATKKALQRDLAALNQEQQEAKHLLDEVLQQIHQSPPQPRLSIPQSALPIPSTLPPASVPCFEERTKVAPTGDTETSSLSIYQQQLLPHRNLIGPRAWAALGGDNLNLAARLFQSIQGQSGKTVELFCLKANNFKLQIDDKEHNYPYKF